MKEFKSITDFVGHLATVVIATREAEEKILKKAAVMVEKRAKAKIGEYQEQIGPFVAWAELSENTLYGGFANGIHYPGKIELGYATEGDHNPLLRSGEMRDSVEHTVRGTEAQIGSNSDIAVWQELGTQYIPPRSFLGGAMAEKLPEILKMTRMTYVAALVGEEVYQGSLPIGE